MCGCVGALCVREREAGKVYGDEEEEEEENRGSAHFEPWLSTEPAMELRSS